MLSKIFVILTACMAVNLIYAQLVFQENDSNDNHKPTGHVSKVLVLFELSKIQCVTF